MQEIEIQRPLISEYQDPVEFLRDMIQFRKKSESSFSILSACKTLRRVSPTLVSLILKHQRKITVDRVEELSHLMRLTASEKFFFKNWVQQQDGSTPDFMPTAPTPVNKNRKEVSTHILSDWLNVYVKDCFQIPAIQKNPEKLFEYLKPIATQKRIERSLQFLLQEGHLRKTLSGHIEPEVNLTVTDPQVSSQKIRQFHKSALAIAKSAIDLYSPQERWANTLLIPLHEKAYGEFLEMIQEFAQKIQSFAENKNNHTQSESERLYQFVLNLSPTGGQFE